MCTFISLFSSQHYLNNFLLYMLVLTHEGGGFE